jgi:hypothetical protein
MSRHPAASQDRQVQVMLPAVCPGVARAVITVLPTRSVSPSRTLRSRATGAKGASCAAWGSSGPLFPAARADAPARLATTTAPVSRDKAASPPAWS